MQDHPGAPGTARQESTRTIVSTYDGGTATQPRAPGHERPFTALRAAKHGRLSAASTAPGADIPPTTTAGAPGQYCQSAAPRAPGHGRPLAIAAGESCRDRLSAASTATAPSPAGPRRLRQVSLPRTPATPNTLTSPHTHQDTASSFPRQRKSGPVPTDAVGGLNGSPSQPAAGHHVAPSPGLAPGEGWGGGDDPPTPPFTKCILPSRFRPARGLAPPRIRASFCTTTLAPRPRLLAENLPLSAMVPLLRPLVPGRWPSGTAARDGVHSGRRSAAPHTPTGVFYGAAASGAGSAGKGAAHAGGP